VYGAIEQATSRKGQQGTASPQEAAERAAQLKTQGRKGCKAIRINMAFTPENHEFIKVMATISGKTMTEFANLIVERYRNEHPEIYEQAKAIIDQL
jgi:enhancing lycopene biosynthesis protein 2